MRTYSFRSVLSLAFCLICFLAASFSLPGQAGVAHAAGLVVQDDTWGPTPEDVTNVLIPAADLMANDTPEGTKGLSIVAAAAAANCTVSLDGGDVRFTPDPDFFGSATFTYTVRDVETLTEATATVTVTVTPVAEAPSITDAATAEDTQTTDGLVITRNPVDGDEVGYFKISGITGGKLFKNDGTSEIKVGDYITVAEGGAGLRFTPSADLNTPAGDTFSVSVQASIDNAGTGISPAATAAITVSEVNDPPKTIMLTDSTASEDTAYDTYLPSLLDFNPGYTRGADNEAGQTLTVIGISDVVNLLNVRNLGGWIFADLPADFNGEASFKYTIQDNGTTAGVADPLTAVGTVTVLVRKVNDPPVGGADDLTADHGLTVMEDSPTYVPFADLLDNDQAGPSTATDELAGQTITVSGVSNPSHCAVTIGTEPGVGDVVYITPEADYSGPAGFSYTLTDDGTTETHWIGVEDSDPKSTTVAVTFTVAPVGDMPSITATSTAEDTQTTDGLVITRNPADGDEIGYFKIAGIAGGRLFKNDGVTPLGVGDYITVAEGGAGLRFTPSADLNTPAGNIFGVTVQAAADASGAGLGADTATAAITVTEVNDPPAAIDDALAPVAEDSGPRTIPFADLLANDTPGPNENGQSLVITGVGDAVGGDVWIMGSDVVFAVPEAYCGPAGFTYTVTDNGTTNGAADPLTDTATVTFTVNPIADVPSITGASTTEDTQTTDGLVITRNPVDGDEIGYFKISDIGDGRLYKNDGVTEVHAGDYITVAEGAAGLRFTPSPDKNSPAGGLFHVTVQASVDAAGTGLSVSAMGIINVSAVNDEPVYDGFSYGLGCLEDSGLGIGIDTASLLGHWSPGPNEFDQTLRITGVSNPVGLVNLSLSGGSIFCELQPDFYGDATFDYTVEDDGTTGGESDPLSVTKTLTAFEVTEINDSPVAADDTLTDIAEDSGSWTIPASDLLANDRPGPDNESDQTLTVAAVSDVVGGTAVVSGGDVIFTPTADYFGPAGFTYTVQDNGTTSGLADPLTDTAAVTFTVTPVADTPSISGTQTAEDTPTTSGLVITRNPADGDEIGFFKVADVTGGRLFKNDGVTEIHAGDFVTVAEGGAGLRFIPAADLSSPAGDTFSVTVQASADDQGTGLSEPVTANIFVSEVNDPPVAVDDSLSTLGPDPGVRTIPLADLLGNDKAGPANESAQTLAISSVSSPIGGTVSIDGSNIAFEVDPSFHGQARFTYEVRDDGTTSGSPDPKTATGTVRFRVLAPPPPPPAPPAPPAPPEPPEPTPDPGVEWSGAVTETAQPDAESTVTGADGAATVVVPAGAATEPLAVTVAKVESFDRPAAGMVMVAGQVYQVSAETTSTGEGVHTFTQPLTLTFTYTDDQLASAAVAEEDLQICYWDEDLEAWIAVPTTIDPVTKQVTTRVDHLTVFAVMERTVPDFPDITGNWAETEILKLASLKIINGYTDGTFGPDDSITREEFAKMIVLAAGLEPLSGPDATLSFVDAAETGDWAVPYVAAAVKAGIIKGVSATEFDPKGRVSLAQAATMVARAVAAKAAGATMPDGAYEDQNLIPDWAAEGVAFAHQNQMFGGLTGDKLGPSDDATRAQVARMLSRLLDVRFGK